MSYGVETRSQRFHALTLVDAARGTSRTADAVLFEGAAVPAALPSGAPTIVIGLPRGDGLALVDDDGFVRDASLVVVEELVDELRRRGLDVRLDRESTLALAPRGLVPTLRLTVWIDTISVRRAPTHVDAHTRLHLWARGADGAARWEDDFALQIRERRAPFDVLRALGQAASDKLAPRLRAERSPRDEAETKP